LIQLKDTSYQTPSGIQILSNVTATFYKNDNIGILAAPGSGKSTIAKLLCNTYAPTEGAINILGRVSWPIGFAGAFHPELTGKRNLQLIADITGQNYLQMIFWCEKFGRLTEQLNYPLKNYTPADRAMIAYCCSLGSEADWFISDENISVGSSDMLHSCVKAIKSKTKDSGLVLISKNKNQISRFCDRYFVLLKSKLIEVETVELADKLLYL
jgi:capsular polysaccharide transport system ATP-binding protein